MSCECNRITNQGKQYCQECMPDEFHWLVPVSKEPDPFLMDRNHAYIGPNNIIYVLSRDRVRAIKITTSEGNIDLSPYALKEELASKISELTTKLTQGLEGAKYFEGEGIRIDEDNRIHSTVTLTEVNQRLDSLEQVDTSPYKAGTGIEITPDLTINSTVDVSGLVSRVQDLEEQEDKDTTYTAGAGLQLSDTEFSVNPNDLPGADQLVDLNTRVTALENDTDADTKYTAGTNIQISGSNVISATDTTYSAGSGIQISPDNVISSDVTIPYLDNKLKLTRSKVSKVILSPFAKSQGTSTNGSVTYKLTEDLIREDYNSLYIRIFPTGYVLNGNGTTDSSSSVSLEFTVPLFEPTFTLNSKAYSQTTDIEVEAMLICNLGGTNITFTHSKLIVTLGKYSGSPIVLTSPGRHFMGLPNVYKGTINKVNYSLTTNDYPQFTLIGTKFIV